MSDKDARMELLDGLLEDIRRLAEGSPATSIEVEAEGISIAITRAAQPAATAAAHAGPADAKTPEPARVRSASVGIFSASKEWIAGDEVKHGTVLGAVQSLGAMSDVVAPFDGVLTDVLLAGGAPVEYGQPLFAIEKR